VGTPTERDRTQDVLYSLVKTMARHSAVYGIFDFLGRAGAFLLVPLYARVMAPAEFGTLEIFTVSWALLLTVLVLGFNSALVRYYVPERDPAVRTAFFRTAFTTVLLTAGAAAVILFAAAPAVSRLIFHDSTRTGLWRLLFLWVLVDAAGIMLLSLFRSQGRPYRYSLVNLTKLFSVLLLNILLVGVLRKGVAGALTGNLLGSVLGMLLGLAWSRREFGLSIRRDLLRRLAGFGLPLVVSGLGLYVMNSADRFFLNGFGDLTELGIYSLGYKVGLSMSVILNAFVVAWPPIMFRIADEENAPVIFARVLTYYTLVTCGILIAVASMSHEIVFVIAGSEYAPAAALVPLILIAYLVQGIYYILSVGVTVTDRTKWVPVVVGAAAVVNLAGNYLLIPHFKIWGAAWATLISFLCLPVGMWLVARRFYPILFEARRLMILLAGTAVVLAVNLALIGHVGPVDFVLKLAVMLAFPVLLVVLGFFSGEERVRARQFLQRLRRRRKA
jgi:O-antigen/teichoic acid export membrane protein